MISSKIVILNRRGLPFVINHFKKRNLFVLGSVLCLILILTFSCFIWPIQISGNQTYTDEMILKYLNNKNIRTGTPVWKINCAELAATIRQEYDDIIWVSASIDGSFLRFKIKEKENSPNLIDTNTKKPMDIIAEKDCLIKEIIVRTGIPMVKPGEYVKKGAILVSGQIPIYNDAKEVISYQNCISDAEIRGEHILEYHDSISYLKKEKIIYNDIFKKEYYIKFNDKILTLGNIKNKYDASYLYSLQKSFYAISYGLRIVKPYQSEIQKYSQRQVQEILTERFSNYCKEL